MPFISFVIPSQHNNVVQGHFKAHHTTKELQYEGMLSTVTELLVLSSMDGIVRSYSTFAELAAQSGLIPPIFVDFMGGESKRMEGHIRSHDSAQVENILAHCAK